MKYLAEHQYAAFIILAILGFFCICNYIYMIYCFIINQKNFKKFRDNLKVGDETDEGKVVEIWKSSNPDRKNNDEDTIIIQVKRIRGFLRPANPDRKSIYRYPEQK